MEKNNENEDISEVIRPQIFTLTLNTHTKQTKDTNTQPKKTLNST